MDPTMRFVELVNGPNADIDLIEGWALFDQLATPGADPASLLQQVDDISSTCSGSTVAHIVDAVFVAGGFRGDQDNYYSPQNSLLSGVLERRLGLPISLAALLIAVADRHGVALSGVGMPGHFLVKADDEPDLFIDAFAGGAVMNTDDCEQLFRTLAGAKAPFLPQYLDTVSTASVLCRMAANLVNAYRRDDQRRHLRWAARLRAHCPRVPPGEHVQLGQALVHAGAFDEAAAVFDAAAETIGPSKHDAVAAMAAQARAKLN